VNRPGDEHEFWSVMACQVGNGSITGRGKPGLVAGLAGLHVGEAVGPRWAMTRAKRRGGMGGQAGPMGRNSAHGQ
jgi:hypothetical protein